MSAVLGTVTISPAQARAACTALAVAVCADDIEDCLTWHGGLGADRCEFCEALVILRSGAGYWPKDHLRP